MKISFIKFFKNKMKKNNNKILKKNQMALVAMALMLVTAGYMNYINGVKEVEKAEEKSELGDAKLVSTEIKEKNEIINNENNENKSVDSEEKNDNAKLVNNEEKKDDDDYFAKTKLERDKMYSQMIETYQQIIENNKISNEQKNIATNEIKNINNKKGAISAIESLLNGKKFENCLILINDNNIDVVVKSNENITTEQVAQIQNIVSRELNAKIEDIHISTHP